MSGLESSMATARLSHDQREQEVLTDLQRHFPAFADAVSWSKVPDGQDPPDFIGHTLDGPVGLELIEWLDGGQMGPAKGRESQRDNIRRVVHENWQARYQPQNFNLAVLMPIGVSEFPDLTRPSCGRNSSLAPRASTQLGSRIPNALDARTHKPIFRPIRL